MVTFEAFLLLLAAVAGWVVFVAIAPVGKCGRCKGERVARHYWHGRKIRCPRCRGYGLAYRRGAVIVHKLVQHAREAFARGDELPQPPREDQ